MMLWKALWQTQFDVTLTAGFEPELPQCTNARSILSLLWQMPPWHQVAQATAILSGKISLCKTLNALQVNISINGINFLFLVHTQNYIKNAKTSVTWQDKYIRLGPKRNTDYETHIIVLLKHICMRTSKLKLIWFFFFLAVATHHIVPYTRKCLPFCSAFLGSLVYQWVYFNCRQEQLIHKLVYFGGKMYWKAKIVLHLIWAKLCAF